MKSDRPEDLRQQMMAVRSALYHDVRTMAVEARRSVDWKHHFQAHPFVWCGGAAMLGFLLAPSMPRRRTGPVLTERDRQTLVTSALPSSATSGAAAALQPVAINFVARAVSHAASQYLSQFAHASATQNAERSQPGKIKVDEAKSSMILRNVDELCEVQRSLEVRSADVLGGKSSARELLNETLIAHPRGSLVTAAALGVVVRWIVKRHYR